VGLLLAGIAALIGAAGSRSRSALVGG